MELLWPPCLGMNLEEAGSKIMSLEGIFLKNSFLTEYLLSLNLPTFGTRCKVILRARVLCYNRPQSPWHSAYCCLSLSFNIVCHCLSTRAAAPILPLETLHSAHTSSCLHREGSGSKLPRREAQRHHLLLHASPAPRFRTRILPRPGVAWRTFPWVREDPQPHTDMKP